MAFHCHVDPGADTCLYSAAGRADCCAHPPADCRLSAHRHICDYPDTHADTHASSHSGTGAYNYTPADRSARSHPDTASDTHPPADCCAHPHTDSNTAAYTYFCPYPNT